MSKYPDCYLANWRQLTVTVVVGDPYRRGHWQTMSIPLECSPESEAFFVKAMVRDLEQDIASEKYSDLIWKAWCGRPWVPIGLVDQ